MAKPTRRSLLAGASFTAVAGRAALPQIIASRAAAQGNPATVGYSAVVQMFGSGAIYNSDGTVTGVPNGALYTYSPDAPDNHTRATNEGNFVSDFAGFTQGSIHCRRDDTALRVYFRKDVTPDPTRIEIVFELGHFTTDGSAANLGPFSLQILKEGVPQNIPVNTVSGAGNTWVPGGSTFTGTTKVTTAYFPSMGWFTRWRWNPTPRPVVRTNTQLLPANLNLLPNFSASLASTYKCVDCGQPGGVAAITAYSSAWAPTNALPGQWSNYNPVGVNEATGIVYGMGQGGARADIGIMPEWHCNWAANGNHNALKAMLVLAEVDGGIPWIWRDAATNWAPANLINTPGVNVPPKSLNRPTVIVPSTQSQGWQVDVSHHPCLSYIPYLITGDPFFLENLQFVAAFCNIGAIGGAYFGLTQNLADPNSPKVPPSPLLWASWRYQTRSIAWTLRTIAAAYIATPSSVPSWLQPKSYWKQVLDYNAGIADSYGDAWSSNPASAAFPYSYLTLQGELPNSLAYEQGFMLSYWGKACGFAVSQGGLSSWSNYYAYSSLMLTHWANGSGVGDWDKRFPAPYSPMTQAFSTDYDGNPSQWASWSDLWNWHVNSGFVATNVNNVGWGWLPIDNYHPAFSAWASGQSYKCNSWIFEVRSGCPIVPNLGDVITLTITGPFAGSPVRVSHTITSGDLSGPSSLVQAAVNILSGNTATNPVTTDLIAQINASSSLRAAGITANTSNTVPGAGTFGSGAFQTKAYPGRIYISFDSVTGPAYISVTGSLSAARGGPTTSGCSLYIQPNGDGCTAGSATFIPHRPLEYQCAKTGTSGVAGNAPGGTALQTVITTGDGLEWCFCPELKSVPMFCPGGSAANFPDIGYGGAYGNVGFTPYIMELWSTIAFLQRAGITGGSTGYANMTAILNRIFSTPRNRGSFSLCIAP